MKHFITSKIRGPPYALSVTTWLSITDISNGATALLTLPLDLHLEDLFRIRKPELADWHLADFLLGDPEWADFLEQQIFPISQYIFFGENKSVK